MPAVAVGEVDNEGGDNGDNEDSLLEACYVLHGAPSKVDQSPRQAGRPARRKVEENQTGMSKKDFDWGDAAGLPPCLKDEPPLCGLWRAHAFKVVWARVERLIQAKLDEVNEASFKEINRWVCNRQFCDAQQQLYRSARIAPVDDLAEPTVSTKGHHVVGSFNKELHTALLFLGGVDPSDHQDTFNGLVAHLKMFKCHVARLLPNDFPSKCHIAVPLNSLLRQFVQMTPETTDLEILAAWYAEPPNFGRPVVISIENMERCNAVVLAELIVLLSEWSAEIPIVLLMGIATTADVLQRFLPSSALSRLNAQRFALKAPIDRLESIVKAALVDCFSAFEISHVVAQHMKGFFLRHDLTVSSFIMSLKVACMEHFCKEPLSFMSEWLLKCSSQADLEEQCGMLPEVLLEYACSLLSVESQTDEHPMLFLSTITDMWRIFPPPNSTHEESKTLLSVSGRKILGDDGVIKHIAGKLWALREQKQLWSVALLCLYEVGKQSKLGFTDLFCEALRPPQTSEVFHDHDRGLSTIVQQRTPPLSITWQELKSRIRDLTLPVLRGILEEWKRLTCNISELHADICSIHTTILSGDRLDRQNTLTPSSTGRSEIPSTPLTTSYTPDNRPNQCSPLRRPLFKTSLEQSTPSPSPRTSRRPSTTSKLLKTPEKSPPGSRPSESPQKTSTRLLKGPENASPLSGPLESPRRASTRLLRSPEKMLAATGSLGSPRKTKTSLLKSPEKLLPASDLLQSPRRTSTRLLNSPEKANGSPRRSSSRLLKSPEKALQVSSVRESPRKHPKSPSKTSSAAVVRESPRKKLAKSPLKKTPPSQQSMSRSDLRKMVSQNSLGGVRAGMKPLNQLVADMLERIIVQFLVPSEVLPFHEVICFKDVSLLKQATTGETRQKVQLDLLGSQLRLQCECCHPDGLEVDQRKTTLPALIQAHHLKLPYRLGLSVQTSATDGDFFESFLAPVVLKKYCIQLIPPSGRYQLSQEHNDLINVHDWYQSFSSICCPMKDSGKSAKKKKRKRPPPEPSFMDTTTLQASFARAATELQLAGLIRLPKKGRPDFAQKVGLG